MKKSSRQKAHPIVGVKMGGLRGLIEKQNDKEHRADFDKLVQY